MFSVSELLKIDNVAVEFHARKGLLSSTKVQALDGVSIQLNKGETLALVGESGSGKTTLARVCLRLVDITRGEVYFDGQNITNLKGKQLRSFRKNAQGIFQDPFSSLDPYMSVRQIVEEPLIILKQGSAAERYDRICTALEEVRLQPAGEIATKFTHQLSGGQRQRVAIARALVTEPELIVADEPVSMIDASSRAEILYLMNELREKRGTAFVYITHDIATAYHFAQRIAVMYLGKIVERGAMSEVISNPLHPYTEALLKAVPKPDPQNRFRRRATVKGEAPSSMAPPSGCRFHPRCSFKFGPCATVEPRLQSVRESHMAACHLFASESVPYAQKSVDSSG